METANPNGESDPEVELRLKIDPLKMKEVIKNFDPETLQELFTGFLYVANVMVIVLKKIIPACAEEKRALISSPVTTNTRSMLTNRPVNKFIELFNPEYIDDVKEEFRTNVRPLMTKGSPSMDPQRIIDFRMRGRDMDGNAIQKMKIYHVFKTLKPYLRKDLTKSDYAKYLSEHVLGIASDTSWVRYL